MSRDLLRRATATRWPPSSPAPGPRSTTKVGGADGLLVVLHDEDRIAEVPQAFEGVKEAAVVALMETDAGLVEDVEHAHEARPYLGGQAYPLPLTSRERGRGPVERQVLEPHVSEEPRRSRISLSTRRAIWASRSERVRVSKNCRADLIEKRTTSEMERPAIFTASVSGRSREP